MLHVLSVVVALLATPHAVPDKCKPAAAIIETNRTNGVYLVPLTQEQVNILTLLFNSAEPKTENRYTLGYWGDLKTSGVIYLGNGKLICDRLTIGANLWKKIRKELVGTGI
jgi:hypothetical protein